MIPDLSFLKTPLLTLVGTAVLFGFYAGHAARRLRLPSLIGYMLIGVVLGPSILGLFSESSMNSLSFITEVALGFVAFSIGAELSLSSLKKLGPGIVIIILAESFGAFALVLAAVYFLTRDLPLALVFASVAPASAPAGTVAVIQECRAKGSLTKALYAVVGFDDGLAIVIFGFAAAIAKNLLVGEVSDTNVGILAAMYAPMSEVFISIVLGTFVGFVFCQLVKRLNNARDILILVTGTILIVTGLSIRWHLSLILTNMVVGFVLVNTRRETLTHHVLAPLHDVMPLLFVLFFCLAGAHLELSALPSLGLLGIVYIIARSTGLMGGAYLGGAIGNVEPRVKKYVGMGILSQAGVAIGLSLIVQHEFAQIHAEYGVPHSLEIGAKVLTTITATCIFFEIIGPILTKIALRKAGEIEQA